MKNKEEEKIITIFLILTVIFAIAFLVYYTISSNIRNYKYTDKEEYETVEKGITFIEKLPIHFNILNQSFHNIDSIKQEYKEGICLAYYLKNSITNDCSDNENEICIYKKDLEDNNIFDTFNTNFDFTSKQLNLYLDQYGTQTLYQEKDDNNQIFYRLHLKASDTDYQIYSSFDHFQKKKNEYLFYMYQGYYDKKTSSKYELYDLITNEKVYEEDTSKDLFENIKQKDIKKLQLYKYILKKNNKGEYYLYGFNPVKK